MPETPRTLAAERAAEAALEAAWGDAVEHGGRGDGRSALPQAVQLRRRILVGRDMLAHETDPDKRAAIREGLEALHAALAKADADPADRRRCRVWRDAYKAWRKAYWEVMA